MQKNVEKRNMLWYIEKRKINKKLTTLKEEV